MEKNKLIIIVICIIAIGGAVYYFTKGEDDYTDFEEIENIENVIEVANEQTEIIELNKIVVHIAGEVINPGVIEIDEGSRIVDAINEAGGVSEEADLSDVNLAYILEDAQKIYIPNINEKNEREIVINNIESKKENKKVVININTANLEQLQNIPGVGEATALKIIDYRNKNGKFNSIEDIQNVNGIGSSKFGKMKDYICVK